ncbi:MAG: hypothetical protein Ct9H300mP16_19640 [Pseudomonadota bacterium]|nr:MAG: hypothetical protein Ct9H300mP16_19640 [Pseudomonadota bacterium]
MRLSTCSRWSPAGEKKWRERPFVSCSCCHVVPPLRFAEDACRVLESVSTGDADSLLAAGQAGATSPAALAGSVVQETAEVLAGLVYVNLLNPVILPFLAPGRSCLTFAPAR